MSVWPVFVTCSLAGLTAVPRRLKPPILTRIWTRIWRRARLKLGMRSNSLRPCKSPFPLLHHLREFLEQIVRIMRAGRSFRVILHAE